MRMWIYIFFLLSAPSVYAQDSLFEEETLGRVIADYEQHYEKSLKGELSGEEFLRYARALAKLFIALDPDTFNEGVLIKIMDRYLQSPQHQPAWDLCVLELSKEMDPELKDQKNHVFWKAPVDGAIDGFYVVFALAAVTGFASKSKLAGRCAASLRKITERWLRKSAEIGVQRATGAAMSGIYSPRTFQGMCREFLYSLRTNPGAVASHLMGTPGRSRVLRFMAAGALIESTSAETYYHFLDQKWDPQKLLEKVRFICLLEWASKVMLLKSEVEFDFNWVVEMDALQLHYLKENLKKNKEELERLGKLFQKHYQSYLVLVAELAHWMEVVPHLQANWAFQDGELVGGGAFTDFLQAMFEEYEGLEDVFYACSARKTISEAKMNLEEVTHFSLEPLQIHLAKMDFIFREVANRLGEEEKEKDDSSLEKEEKKDDVPNITPSPKDPCCDVLVPGSKK